MEAPWKIIRLELSKPLDTLSLPEGYRGILAIFCYRGIPLGERNFTDTELAVYPTRLYSIALETISSAVGGQLLAPAFQGKLPVIKPHLLPSVPPDYQALSALQSPLKQIEKKLKSQLTDNISVIVCTRDRPQQLYRCLHSLTELASPPLEILVVDNAPTSNETRTVVEKFPQVKYILEPEPGLSVARNTGIDRARGDIIAFTDDDLEVHPYWLAGLQQAFSARDTMAVTGLMLPAELETAAQIYFYNQSNRWEYQPLVFDSQFFRTMQPIGVPVWRIGAGANMAFRSKIFNLIGNFDELLGAGTSGCSEDSEMWYRILAAGWKCRYEPTAVVFHYHRSDLISLQQQMYQYMRGHVVALLIQFVRHRHWGNLRRILIGLPKYYCIRWLKKTLKGNENCAPNLATEIKGCLAGIKYYWQHKN